MSRACLYIFILLPENKGEKPYSNSLSKNLNLNLVSADMILLFFSKRGKRSLPENKIKGIEIRLAKFALFYYNAHIKLVLPQAFQESISKFKENQ